MKYIFSILTFLLLSYPAFSNASNVSEKLPYLVKTTNEFFDTLNQEKEPSNRELATIIGKSCSTLERLLGNTSFLNDVEKFKTTSPDLPPYIEKLKQNLTLFLENFLVPEIEILKSAGLSDNSIYRISTYASYAMSSIEEDMSMSNIIANLHRLRGYICIAEKRIKENLDIEMKRERKLALMRRVGFGMAGIILIAADIYSAAPTQGLSIVSVQIGGELIKDAIPE
ncbi:hypothetical protein ACJJIG_21285 [Microbulbifer sp. SSSA007]|uniref:hypothetical protein n=1 Tax=Microbulbifer sp. SSSA007 TaxID=3243379 RepID=UPI00403959C5